MSEVARHLRVLVRARSHPACFLEGPPGNLPITHRANEVNTGSTWRPVRAHDAIRQSLTATWARSGQALEQRTRGGERVQHNAGGSRRTSSLRHSDLSAVGLMPRSTAAWRSGRSKYLESISLVITMGSEDVRQLSPDFFRGKILRVPRGRGGEPRAAAGAMESRRQTSSSTERTPCHTQQRTERAGERQRPTLRHWVVPLRGIGWPPWSGFCDTHKG